MAGIKTHGQSGARIYHIWSTMKGRCCRKKSTGYKYYGGKGIRVCNEWKNSFVAFQEWAIANGYNEELTIDRIDANKHYCPDNCRWLTMHEQILNQDRNKHRNKEHKYISKRGDNWIVVIGERGIKNRQVKMFQTTISLEEAIEARDYFLEHGEKIDFTIKDKKKYNESLLRLKLGYN